MPPPELDVAVVGAGAVGLGIAWRLAGRGRRVAVFERGEAGRGATWAAAGMLAPAAEIGFEELDLYRLGRESLRRWPTFARALEAATGLDVGYRAEGTLLAADDRDAAEALRRLFQFQRQHGADVRWLTTDEALDVEPLLSPRIAAAVLSPEDHQVDPRALARALTAAVRQSAALHERAEVEAVVPAGLRPDAAAPALVLAGGTRVGARAVVLAAGAWTRGIGGLEAARPPVRPVKGQALALRMEAPFALRHVVRGSRAYLVPKADGRLVVGATSEEVGFDRRVTAGALYRLLDGAVRVVPGVEELEVIETWAGLRPASRDHAPLLGPAAPGVFLAAGHYRHGVLLTPVTADEVAGAVEDYLEGGATRGETARGETKGPRSESEAPRRETSPWLAPFSPLRFG